MRQLPYLVALRQMETGDILQWQGAGDVADTIMRITAYSHSSLIVRMDEVIPFAERDQVMLFEAISSGIEMRIFRERFIAEHEAGAKAFWLRCPMSTFKRHRLREFAILEAARAVPYDYRSLFMNLFGRVPIGADKWFCSEFVWAGLIACGFVSDHTEFAPRPGDLNVWLGNRADDPIELVGPKANEAA